jgi:hypothetical protein
MERWEQFWQNAEKNMEVAHLLRNQLDKNYVGLSLYHAQQALEMAVKACLFKFDLERYLRLKESSDSKSEIVFVRDRSRVGDPLHTHFPISELIYTSFGFIQSQAKKVAKTGNSDFDQSLNDIIDAAKTVRDFVDYVDPPKGSKVDSKEALRRKKELWKLSLQLDIEDQKIKDFISKLRAAGQPGGTSTNFQSSSVQFVKNLVSKLTLALEKTGNERHLIYAKERAQDILKKADFPPELVFLFMHDRNSGAYDAAIEDLVREQGMWPILIRLFSPEGVIKEVQKLRYDTKVANIKGARMLFPFFRINLIWMGYIASIAYVMLFMFPHEEFGRYLQPIDARTSEEIYLERREKANFLIDECDKACQTIKLILNTMKP